MIKSLSVLIPVYNQICVNKVKAIKELCDAQPSLEYEIIVADDCSTHHDTISANTEINELPHCRFVLKNRNEGSGATRNFLARQSKYDWLLFLDCDMDIPDKWFIDRYVKTAQPRTVVNGGIKIGPKPCTCGRNLRYLYEHHEEPAHTAQQRSKNPYKSFRSTNFIIPRSIFMSVMFNESMKRYEDVYFGKILRESNIDTIHIDNPVVMNAFEDNKEYVNKVELDLRTLYKFRDELQGYSRILSLCNTISKVKPLHIAARLWHSVLGPLERNLIIGKYPLLTVLSVYRIGYFLSINK